MREQLDPTMKRWVQHANPVAAVRPHQPFSLEASERRAEGEAADTQLLTQAALGRKALAHGPLAIEQTAAELVDDPVDDAHEIGLTNFGRVSTMDTYHRREPPCGGGGTVVWLGILAACSPTAPYASLEEGLGRPLTSEEQAELPDAGVAVVVHLDRVELHPFGWQAQRQQGLLPDDDPPPVPLDADGNAPDQRGMLIAPLYDQLLAWSSVWLDQSRRVEPVGGPWPPFDADLWLFVDRRTPDATLRRVLHTGGQAMFARFRTVPFGPVTLPTAPRPPALATTPDPTRRDHPLDPLRVGQVAGRDAYVVDDRAGRITVDVLAPGTLVIAGEAQGMAALQRDRGHPVVYPSYAAAAAAATYPVLPSMEMLLHAGKSLDDELLVALQRANEEAEAAWLAAAITSPPQPEAPRWLLPSPSPAEGAEPTALAPDASWHDRHRWTLGSVLVPDDSYEAGDGYRQRLHDAFVVGAIQQQEPTVRSLGLPGFSGGRSSLLEVHLAPQLRVEPVPTHFARRAEVYRWLGNVARRAELTPSLVERVDEMAERHRMLAEISRVDLGRGGGRPLDPEIVARPRRADAPVILREPAPAVPHGFFEHDLDDKLAEIDALLAADAAAPSPETPPAPEPAPVPDEPAPVPDKAAPVPVEVPEASAAARSPGAEVADWLDAWADDPVFGTDVRVVVPADRSSEGVRAWAVLGVRPIDLVVSYAQPPAVRAIDGAEVRLNLVERRYSVLTPHVVEVTLAAPHDPATFRRLSDRHPRVDDLVQALTAP